MGMHLAKMTRRQVSVRLGGQQLTGTAKKSVVGPVAVQAGEQKSRRLCISRA
jgi:hypothetical protein